MNIWVSETQLMAEVLERIRELERKPEHQDELEKMLKAREKLMGIIRRHLELTGRATVDFGDDYDTWLQWMMETRDKNLDSDNFICY